MHAVTRENSCYPRTLFPITVKKSKMNHAWMIGLATVILPTFASGQQDAAQAVANELFKNIKTKLTPAEKKQIATTLNFVPSGKKDEPFALDKESREYPFQALTYPTDLNKDGKEEIFIIFGNSYTSGNTGSSVTLFVSDRVGKYQAHLGFPGMAPDILLTGNMGYPDLLIGGPGFEFPVLRWNGKTYGNFRKIKDADYEKLKKSDLATISKTYQESIKQDP
jgi:hypothetical protein